MSGAKLDVFPFLYSGLFKNRPGFFVDLNKCTLLEGNIYENNNRVVYPAGEAGKATS